MARFRNSKEGATIVESCLVMAFLCLILFGVLQVSILTAASEVLVYASSAGVRCATIGYDDAMVYKATRIGALANMGAKQLSWDDEEDRIQEYLYYSDNIGNGGAMSYISDTYWNSMPTDQDSYVEWEDEKIRATVVQYYPLTFPFVGAFYGESTTELSVQSLASDLELMMEDHADLYLLD